MQPALSCEVLWKVHWINVFSGPESCVIKEKDLIDGLRVLVKLEGHFHPGKIQAISPPDIYGVLVDKERGNKPHIFSREEVLREAVRRNSYKGQQTTTNIFLADFRSQTAKHRKPANWHTGLRLLESQVSPLVSWHHQRHGNRSQAGSPMLCQHRTG